MALVWHRAVVARRRGLSQDLPLLPTIFVVGDRKQSIYGFRDADVAVLRRAAGRISELRGNREPVRRAIRKSFRAVPALLAFTNALCDALDKAPERADAFAYDEHDRFPVDPAAMAGEPALGVAPAFDLASSAQAVAGEIARLLQSGTVRDRQTGVARTVRPGDIAILFRSREGHQEFETALQDLGISTYVYKGLGFFDTDEVTDVVAALRLLADPASDLRRGAFSDRGSSGSRTRTRGARRTSPRRLRRRRRRHAARCRQRCRDSARAYSVPGWIALADRVPPAGCSIA